MNGGERNTCVQTTSTGMSKRDRIRQLNDAFRRVGPPTSRFCISHGIIQLGCDAIPRIMTHVRAFNKFDDGNDPYGEHDFGALTWRSHKLFWKIDYYDCNIEFGSPDPSDAAVTTRVLTIMLASEY